MNGGDLEVDLDAISVVRPPECPPWLLQQPNIFFSLSDLRKGDTYPLVFQSMFLGVILWISEVPEGVY